MNGKRNIIYLMLACILLTSFKPEFVHKTRRGIIVAAHDSLVRAMEPFKGASDGGTWYAETVNKYDSLFGENVRVYCMVIPTSVAYYCPDTARLWTNLEEPTINTIYGHLAERVVPIDVFNTLRHHTEEPIYSRTDHHWAPLGAYYAAQEFARVAQVPFRDLESYDTLVIRNYVGTMYRFSGDIRVMQSPEEFTYYIPRDVDIKTTYTVYTLDKRRTRVIAQSEPEEGSFFREYPDGSNSAYLTFMGGDTRLTSIETSTQGNRRLLILKDSYGNALPAYLFYSFNQIHVADCRYFTENICDYISRHQITDILFANNLGHAYNVKTSQNYLKYIRQ